MASGLKRMPADPASGKTHRELEARTGTRTGAAPAWLARGVEYSHRAIVDTKPRGPAGRIGWPGFFRFLLMTTYRRQVLSMFECARVTCSSRAARFLAIAPTRGALFFAAAWLLAGCNTLLGIHEPSDNSGGGGGISNVNLDAGRSDSSFAGGFGSDRRRPGQLPTLAAPRTWSVAAVYSHKRATTAGGKIPEWRVTPSVTAVPVPASALPMRSDAMACNRSSATVPASGRITAPSVQTFARAEPASGPARPTRPDAIFFSLKSAAATAPG